MYLFALATRGVRVKTRALAARLLEQAVLGGTRLRALIGDGPLESHNSGLCVQKGFFLPVKLEPAPLCSEAAGLTQRVWPEHLAATDAVSGAWDLAGGDVVCEHSGGRFG